VPNGLGALLVFALAMQSVLLSALLTFARTPWYSGYARTTTPWGLEALADQQLAGVIMWIPAGAVHPVAALAWLVAWVRAAEGDDIRAVTGPRRSQGTHPRPGISRRAGGRPHPDA
jgi:putative membrane protein